MITLASICIAVAAILCGVLADIYCIICLITFPFVWFWKKTIKYIETYPKRYVLEGTYIDVIDLMLDTKECYAIYDIRDAESGKKVFSGSLADCIRVAAQKSY